jgi:hypothetical protein
MGIDFQMTGTAVGQKKGEKKMAGTVIMENICLVTNAMWACNTNLS